MSEETVLVISVVALIVAVINFCFNVLTTIELRRRWVNQDEMVANSIKRLTKP